MSKQKRIAIIHPKLKAGGGSEAVALWAIEALKAIYDITLITMEEPNFELLNECYGTQIRANQIRVVTIPIPFVFKDHFSALKKFRLVRYCQKHSREFDIMISAYNVLDMRTKGIQIIGDFSFDDNIRREMDYAPGGVKKILYMNSPLRHAYLRLGEILAGSSKKRWKQNPTIANSEWSRQLLLKYYNIHAATIYPPVQEFPFSKSWDKREDGFVCLGRVSPEKGIEHIIQILSEVRLEAEHIHLHIVGTMENNEYGKRIHKLWEDNKDWIFLNGPAYGENKMEIISDHKYGISGRKNEPFGIAVAEMVKAGNIVWVPNGGGQTEIVGSDSLIYSDAKDAVNKIREVLRNAALRETIRDLLTEQSARFSITRFQYEIKRYLEGQRLQTPS